MQLDASSTNTPVVFPGPDQTGVELQLGPELPNPLQGLAGRGQTGDTAITLEPSCGHVTAPSAAHLQTAAGDNVPTLVVSPGAVLAAVGGERTVSQAAGSENPLPG
jgi:hypothetical protein